MTRPTTDPFGFVAAIDDDVIDNLTPAQLDAVATIFNKEN